MWYKKQEYRHSTFSFSYNAAACHQEICASIGRGIHDNFYDRDVETKHSARACLSYTHLTQVFLANHLPANLRQFLAFAKLCY